MTAIYLEPKMVPAQLRGSYTGTKFKAHICETMTIPASAGLWDGGSRETYKAIYFATGREIAVSAPWDNSRADREVTLSPQFCVVEHSIFCGKDMGLTFYVHPETAAKLLPAPQAELTAFERIVLKATQMYKSSHNGRDRYSMAAEDSRYDHCARERQEGVLLNHEFPTRAQWDETKSVLIAKGLLNKAGAITVAGRNAI